MRSAMRSGRRANKNVVRYASVYFLFSCFDSKIWASFSPRNMRDMGQFLEKNPKRIKKLK